MSQAFEQQPTGILEPGNIDLNARPLVNNEDGSVSTVRSMSANIDGREVLLPTVADDGSVISDDEAVSRYMNAAPENRKHLGIFDTPENATAYAERLHEQQARQYAAKDDVSADYVTHKLQERPWRGV